QTQINEPVNGSIQDNIFDIDGDPLTTALVSGPGHGNLILNPNGSYTYQPAADFTGQDSFIYSASDGQIGADPVQGTVTITVEGETITLPLIEEEASVTTAPATPQIEDIGQIERIDDLQWLAEELGLCEGDQQAEDENRCQEITQAYLAGAFLQSTDMQPYQAAGRLRGLAAVLHDPDGSRVAALGRAVAEFAQSPVPPSEEQMASIAEAFAVHSNDGTHYATAGQWLDALSEYVGILNSDIGWPQDESIAFVMGKYGTAITEAGDVSVIAFVQMYLEGIGG
ncbi:MAG: cadherin-like domain-containing protein, partial [Planctomycetota bacterium]